MVNAEQNTKPQGISWYHPAFLIATWFGIGKIPFAPGTWGSLFTFPLFIASHYLLAFVSSEEQFINLYLFFMAILFFVGQWATNIYMKRTGTHDPKEVVIDEVVGQMLVFLAAFLTICELLKIFDILYDDGGKASIPMVTELFLHQSVSVAYITAAIPTYILCFGLFRLFDIWKPWPINYCDKNIGGGFGVMFDDLFAAMYAVISFYLIALLITFIIQT